MRSFHIDRQARTTILAAALLLLITLLVSGCQATPTPAAPTAVPIAEQPTATEPAPTATLTPLPPTATPTATPEPPRIALGETITGTLRAAVESWATSQGAQLVPAGAEADVRIETTQTVSNATQLNESVYAVADWFPTLRTGITVDAVRGLWQGQPTADGLTTLLASPDTAAAMQTLWGAPSASVTVLAAEEIPPRLWQEKEAIAIVPFDQLEPRLSQLPLDGQNVLDRTMDLTTYPLVVHTVASGDPALVESLAAAVREQVPATNRDLERLTTLIMTGVTAMARDTAWVIEQEGDPAYPARKIADVLSAADITHISNEIPFVEGCRADRTPNLLVLCSKPSYMEAIKLVGTDIIGLTGNHMLDYGRKNFLSTLDLYDQEGLPYYAGGRNAEEARRTLFIEDHGNKLAFLGANSFGPPINWATEDTPGAQRYNPNTMKEDIAAAQEQADVVLVEYQAEETYEYAPSYNNRNQFRATIDAGADIVTGVQAHQPQAVELSEDGKKIILYGLGNLFFDQMFNPDVRRGLIPRHTIYQGRLLQTELLTTILENYSQPRWATPEEREIILNNVFGASGFK